jgi:hypothetical protein
MSLHWPFVLNENLYTLRDSLAWHNYIKLGREKQCNVTGTHITVGDASFGIWKWRYSGQGNAIKGTANLSGHPCSSFGAWYYYLLFKDENLMEEVGIVRDEVVRTRYLGTYCTVMYPP